MAEGFADFEMEEFNIVSYPECDTTDNTELEDQIDNLRKDILEMDDKDETDIGIFNEKNERLIYAESVLENRTNDLEKFKDMKWIDEDKNYKQSTEGINSTIVGNLMIVKFASDVFRKNGTLRTDKTRRHVQMDYVKLTRSLMINFETRSLTKFIKYTSFRLPNCSLRQARVT